MVGQSLSKLGALYSSQGRYAEAEPLFKRTLAIIQTSLGPKHPGMARVLYRYAEVMRKTGRSVDAVKLEARARAVETAAGLKPGGLKP